MNKNILVLVFLILMIASSVYAVILFKEVDHQKKEVAKREEKLKADSAKNVAIQRERDSLLNKILWQTSSLIQNDSLKSLYQNLQKASDASSKLNDLSSYEQAAALEKEGFNAIANNEFDSALAKFNMAEKVSPSFHSSYEISRLLSKQKENLDNPETQQVLKNQILKNYSWKAPPEQKKKLEDQLKQNPAKTDAAPGQNPKNNLENNLNKQPDVMQPAKINTPVKITDKTKAVYYNNGVKQ
jgi:hypothetical protein